MVSFSYVPDLLENGPKNLDDLCDIPVQIHLWKAKIYIQLEQNAKQCAVQLIESGLVHSAR
jgi:hypothetical protein